MRRLIALIILAAPLAGCGAFQSDWTALSSAVGTVVGASVSPQTADVAISSFDALEVALGAYKRLPPCAPDKSLACSQPSAVAQINTAVHDGRIARDEILGLLKSNAGAAIPVASYKTLDAAISTLRAVSAAYHIQTGSAS